MQAAEIQSTSSPIDIVLKRRSIRRSYYDWCMYALESRNMAPAAHHILLIQTIERVLAGEIKNVIFLMPPGSAKSTYLSVLLPPFYLNPEQYPNNLILACSYSYSLIETFGRQCRDLIALHEKYSVIHSVRLLRLPEIGELVMEGVTFARASAVVSPGTGLTLHLLTTTLGVKKTQTRR